MQIASQSKATSAHTSVRAAGQSEPERFQRVLPARLPVRSNGQKNLFCQPRSAHTSVRHASMGSKRRRLIFLIRSCLHVRAREWVTAGERAQMQLVPRELCSEKVQPGLLQAKMP